MEPITVLSDGSRGISYDNIIQMFRDWMEDEREEPAVKQEQNKNKNSNLTWDRFRYCIVDYRDAEQAISASNAIRAFMPQIPLLVITDFRSLIRKRHLQQITGTGIMKMILWQEREPQKLELDIQRWLQSTRQEKQETMPSAMSIQN